MDLLHSPSDFYVNHASPPALGYSYTAQCAETGLVWQLPRTPTVESIARGLMRQLAAAPEPPQGTLYGVLLVQTATGERAVLKGFSGLLAGQPQRPGWVPPLTAGVQVRLTQPQTLAQLAQLKDQLMALNPLPGRGAHDQMVQRYAIQLQELAVSHRGRKQSRDRSRTRYHQTLEGSALAQALDHLNKESQRDGVDRRRLKQERDQALAPLVQKINQGEQRIKHLKQQYATLAQQWQTQLQAAYAAQQTGKSSVLGREWVGDNSDRADLCGRAAAKLLHYAVTHQLKPLAMAEFWWGSPRDHYRSQQFYGASPADCQTLMNVALLSPLGQAVDLVDPPTLTVLYQDETLIVVDKPSGLPSVPGRRYCQYDSVLSRLRCQRPSDAFLQVVHRLDQATSGVLVLSPSPGAHKALAQQFAQRQVCKTYEAILSRPIMLESGTIDLPLWGNPDERPKQSVDDTYGKPSVTHFQRLQPGEHPRVRFVPHTGRTHQLRVHAAHAQGLNSAILGDALYGQPDPAARLCLHATSIQLIHPVTQKCLRFTSSPPF